MNYSQYIDHTFLKSNATSKEIDKLIFEAIKYNFKSICINSSWVSYAKKKLLGTNVGITSVIGFPLGAMASEAKVFEAKIALDHGATEIDMVFNIGKFFDKKYNEVLKDIKNVKKVCGSKILKVIIETALLTNDQIKKATEIVLESGADFVKTSTGFSTRGATFEDIEIMKKIVCDKIKIKAAGGVKTFSDMVKMIHLGASRIGTSSSVEIIEGGENLNNY